MPPKLEIKQSKGIRMLEVLNGKPYLINSEGTLIDQVMK